MLNMSKITHIGDVQDRRVDVVGSGHSSEKRQIEPRGPLPYDVIESKTVEHRSRIPLSVSLQEAAAAFVQMAQDAKGIRLKPASPSGEMGVATARLFFDRVGPVDRPIDQLQSLNSDLEVAIRRKAARVRIDEGIVLEIPLKDREREIVSVFDLIREMDEQGDRGVSLLLGRANDGNLLTIDLAHSPPHTLIAGTTGSGKTVCLWSMIAALVCLHSADEVELMVMDNKGELLQLPDLPHLVQPVACDDREAEACIDWLESELESRSTYIGSPEEKSLTRLVTIIDEFQGFRCRDRLTNLLRQGRRVKMHFVLAAQSPHHKDVSTQITSNCDTRVCFRTATGSQSHMVLEDTRGKDLLGRGDGLMKMSGRLVRFQGAFLGADADDPESDLSRWRRFCAEPRAFMRNEITNIADFQI